jgi:ABC-type transport system substrate-binding protein
MLRRSFPSLFIVALLLTACAGSPSSAPASLEAGGPVASATREARTLTVAFRYEKNDLSTKTLTQAGQEYRVLLNAGLTFVDGAGTVQPQLASELPKLHTGSWQVFPDGQMETTWKLKPNLTWHDGQLLTADDFVFAWRVYAARDLGIFSPAPQAAISQASAPDPPDHRLSVELAVPGRR